MSQSNIGMILPFLHNFQLNKNNNKGNAKRGVSPCLKI